MRNEELGVRNGKIFGCIKSLVFLFSFLFLIPGLVMADGELAASTNLEYQVTSRPEAKLILSQSFVFPFLQFDHPLTQGNNIKFVLAADITPVSLFGVSEIIWTPAAFFLLSAGGRAGSGWNIPFAHGIGLNVPIGDKVPGVVRKSEIDGKAFDGLIWNTWGAGTLQFDLGVLVPGDWTHIVFQTRQEFRYSAYSRAGPNDSWVYEDDREYRNGWKYFATYVLGYLIPPSPVLKMIGVMAELKKNLTSFPGGNVWGDTMGHWIFSGLGLFEITPRFSATFVLQFKTARNFGTAEFDNDNYYYYYKDQTLEDTDGERRLIFYRVGLMLNYKIK